MTWYARPGEQGTVGSGKYSPPGGGDVVKAAVRKGRFEKVDRGAAENRVFPTPRTQFKNTVAANCEVEHSVAEPGDNRNDASDDNGAV